MKHQTLAIIVLSSALGLAVLLPTYSAVALALKSNAERAEHFQAIADGAKAKADKYRALDSVSRVQQNKGDSK